MKITAQDIADARAFAAQVERATGRKPTKVTIEKTQEATTSTTRKVSRA